MFNIDIFSERIKKVRKQNNLKQEEVGKAINLTGATISRIESSKRAVSVETLVLFAEYFDVSLDYLVGRTDKQEVNK